MCGAVARLGARRLRVEFAAHLHGLGYSRVEAHVPALGLRTRPFVLATPVDGASIDLRLALRISLPPRTGRSAYRLFSSARALRYVVHYLRFLLGR